jgi:hypothetical protein
MTSLVTKATIGLAAIGTTLAFAAPAEAQRYRHRDRHDDAGAAVVAGIAGIAIGAALSSDRRYDYDRRYYRERGYYPRNGYWYRDNYRRYRGYNHCTTRRVYDPYLGRRVRVRYCR